MPKPKPAKKPRNRAAQDATLINVRALKRRVTEVERFLQSVATVVDALVAEYKTLARRRRRAARIARAK